MTGQDKAKAFRVVQRERLRRYLAVAETAGVDAAREALLDGYPELQRQKMGPLIGGVRLIAGFERAVPLFAAIGVRSEMVDVSTDATDAVLEINTTCMCRDAAADLGLDKPSGVLCELDFEATRRAFPELSVCALKRQVDGAHVCVFRYARPVTETSDDRRPA
jgi:hypothetical protein